MAMSDRSKKSNLCYLLLYGGTKVCRALFEKRVNDLKPNNEDPMTWTVDKFLQLNRTNLESKLRREHKSKLTIVYPLAPRTTDINLWDVSLLCFILRESCGLSPTLRMYLEQLRKQRNKIAHLNDKEIDDIEYEYRFEKLKECIRKVLSETEDEALKMTIQDMTTQLEAGLIPNDELLKVEQAICMSSEDIKQEVRNEHKETRKVIEKGDEKLTSTLEMMYSCQQEILRNQQELLRRFESKEEVENPPQEIMMELRTSHCSPQVERSASEEIVGMFNKEIGGISKQLTCTSIDNDSELSASTKNTIELNHAVNDVCREFKERDSAITKAEVGCIVLHVQCSSTLSLLNLLKDYVNGNLDKSMKKLEEAARSLNGCENLRLETIIYEDEFNRVLSVLNFEPFLISANKESSPDENLPEESSALQCASEKEKTLFEWAWSAIRGFLQPRKPSSIKFERFLTSEKEESPPDVNLSEQTPVLQPASEKRKPLFEWAWSAIRGFLQPRKPSSATAEEKEPSRTFGPDGGWNEEYLRTLTDYVKSFQPFRDTVYSKIFIMGPVNAGKSSFVNSIASIDKARIAMTVTAAFENMHSVTMKHRKYFPKSRLAGQFYLMDTVGFEEWLYGDAGCNVDDVIYSLRGHVKSNYQFETHHPDDKTYTSFKEYSTLDDIPDIPNCVVFVIASDEILRDEFTTTTKKKITFLIDFLRKQYVPVVVVLTKIDLICDEVVYDIRRVYQSKAVMSVVRKASKLFGVPERDIFPVRNYTYEVSLNTNQDILLLLAMKRILEYSADRLEFLSEK